jgi:succinate dehydrogenase / fumarate reductase flavoprotein subunit
MQGLADGYFVIPYTIGHYLAGVMSGGKMKLDDASAAFRDAEQGVRDRVTRLLAVRGKRTVDSFHRELGKVMWEKCGMARNADGLREAIAEIPKLRERFWKEVNVLGGADSLNQSLEKAGRVADFLELGELMCRDALHREESCGGHFREEHQTPEGEAKRDDENFRYVAAWEWGGEGAEPRLHKEPLEFEYVHLAQRSYK